MAFVIIRHRGLPDNFKRENRKEREVDSVSMVTASDSKDHPDFVVLDPFSAPFDLLHKILPGTL